MLAAPQRTSDVAYILQSHPVEGRSIQGRVPGHDGSRSVADLRLDRWPKAVPPQLHDAPSGSAGMPPPLPVTPPAQNAVTAYDQAVPETQKRIRNARSSAIALGQSRGD
jgi:hypothetical protein